MSISIIAAVAKNNVIGINNTLPWKLSGDLKYFSKVTTGKIVLMGRKTFDSIISSLGKPLPNRKNWVLSKTEGDVTGTDKIFHNWDEINEAAKKEEIFVIGGASIYEHSIDNADKLYITEVDCAPKGDAFFPEFNKENWKLISEEKHQKDEKNEYDYAFKVYIRK